MSAPKTIKGERRYGVWAGDPVGRKEDRERCAEQVPNPPSWSGAQCSRKRGHGPGGEFCKHHARKLEE